MNGDKSSDSLSGWRLVWLIVVAACGPVAGPIPTPTLRATPVTPAVATPRPSATPAPLLQLTAIPTRLPTATLVPVSSLSLFRPEEWRAYCLQQENKTTCLRWIQEGILPLYDRILGTFVHQEGKDPPPDIPVAGLTVADYKAYCSQKQNEKECTAFVQRHVIPVYDTLQGRAAVRPPTPTVNPYAYAEAQYARFVASYTAEERELEARRQNFVQEALQVHRVFPTIIVENTNKFGMGVEFVVNPNETECVPGVLADVTRVVVRWPAGAETELEQDFKPPGTAGEGCKFRFAKHTYTSQGYPSIQKGIYTFTFYRQDGTRFETKMAHTGRTIERARNVKAERIGSDLVVSWEPPPFGAPFALTVVSKDYKYRWPDGHEDYATPVVGDIRLAYETNRHVFQSPPLIDGWQFEVTVKYQLPYVGTSEETVSITW